MPRAPNQNAEEARKLFESGKKLIEIAEQINVPVGTIRIDINGNATLQKKSATLQLKKRRKKRYWKQKKSRLQKLWIL